jgi:hypothetical protein
MIIMGYFIEYICLFLNAFFFVLVQIENFVFFYINLAVIFDLFYVNWLIELLST